MSPYGSKHGALKSFPRVRLKSALPLKADIAGRRLDVRFVPETDMALFSRLNSE